jgi:hypothetical protein
MSDEVALLRAAGLEAAAKVIEAARAGQAAAQPLVAPEAPAVTTPAPAPEIPAAPLVPAPVAAAQQLPQPPPGKAPLQTVDEWEALNEREQLERMDELDVLLRAGAK